MKHIREYFRNTIKLADSDLREIPLPTLQDTASSIVDDSYQISVLNSRTDLQDTTLSQETDVTISIWQKGLNHPIENYDIGYCRAVDIQSVSIDKKQIDLSDFVSTINTSGVSVDSPDGNDLVYRFDIDFTVTSFYKIN
jgi:hypothetical protein